MLIIRIITNSRVLRVAIVRAFMKSNLVVHADIANHIY